MSNWLWDIKEQKGKGGFWKPAWLALPNSLCSEWFKKTQTAAAKKPTPKPEGKRKVAVGGECVRDATGSVPSPLSWVWESSGSSQEWNPAGLWWWHTPLLRTRRWFRHNSLHLYFWLSPLSDLMNKVMFWTDKHPAANFPFCVVMNKPRDTGKL